MQLRLKTSAGQFGPKVSTAEYKGRVFCQLVSSTKTSAGCSLARQASSTEYVMCNCTCKLYFIYVG